MGNRTTTICDGVGCTAEHDNPVTSRLASHRQYRGWASVHVSDEKTGHLGSYDLCPACVQKMATLLGLKSPEEMFREQVASLDVIDVPGVDPTPLLPPKTCEKCSEPYVGESCYFCPPPSAAPSSTEGT
jgi:hypothetical protein